MPLLSIVALLGAAALFQGMVGGAFNVAGGRLDLVLLLTVSWALLRGSQEGSIAGVAGGLLLDLFSAVPYGLSGLVLGVLGLLTGFGEKSPARAHLVVLISTAVLGTIAFHGAMYLVLQAMGWALPNALMFARVVAPSAFLNGLLMPILFRMMRLLVQASAGGWRRLEL